MKPYGRNKSVKASGNWKKDYHIHRKNRKIENWWEAIINYSKRGAINQQVKKEINEEL